MGSQTVRHDWVTFTLSKIALSLCPSVDLKTTWPTCFSFDCFWTLHKYSVITKLWDFHQSIPIVTAYLTHRHFFPSVCYYKYSYKEYLLIYTCEIFFLGYTPRGRVFERLICVVSNLLDMIIFRKTSSVKSYHFFTLH